MPIVRNSAERRAVYRVQPLVTEGVDVVLLVDGATIPVEEVVDIAITGAALRVAERFLKILPVRGHMRVSIGTPHWRRRAEIDATLIAHEDIGGKKFCRFCFGPVPELPGDWGRELYELLNRRSAYRGITAAEQDEVEIEIALVPNVAAFQRVRLNNLSSTGACVTVDTSLDDRLKLHREVLLRLQLPEHRRPMQLPARLRNRVARSDGILYGLQFDWTRAEDPLGQAEVVLSYVLSRVGNDTAAAVH